MPLRGNQERYLLAETASDACFNIPVLYRIRGTLDAERLREAILAVCARHDACRTVFERDHREGFLPRVLRDPAVDFRVVRLERLEDAAIYEVAIPLLQRKPDVSRLADLHRHFLFRAGEEESVLVLCQHHAVSDGVSMELFAEEVFAVYDRRPLEVADSFYRHTTHAERSSPDWNRAAAYWEGEFKDVEQVPDFAADLAEAERRPVPNFLRRELSDQTSAALERAADRWGVTVFNVLTALFSLQIARQCALSEVSFSIQSAGRHGLPDSPAVIGPFSNALLLRVQIDEAKSLSELARRARVQTRAALLHETLPYHHAQRAAGISPKFALNLYPEERAPRAEGLEVAPREFLNSDSDYALNLRWSKVRGRYTATIFYDVQRISRDRVEAFWERTDQLVDDACAVAEPVCADLLASGVPGASVSRRGPQRPRPIRLHEAFFARLEEDPERLALVHDDASWSYGELGQRVLELAIRLRRHGVGPGTRVALVAARDPSLVVMMLAVSRAGAAFATLDSGYPRDRLVEYARVLSPTHVVVGTGVEHSGDDWGAPLGVEPGRVVELEAELPVGGCAESGPPELAEPSSAEPAYFLFTSGTTGTPRCVAVPHGPLASFVAWQVDRFDLGPDDRFTLLSGLAHDPVMRDIAAPLSIGASLAIPDPRLLRDPRELLAWIEKVGPTVCHLTPPMGRLLLATVDSDPLVFDSLRFLFWGGDMLGGTSPARFDNRDGSLRQVNLYGATETPQAVTAYEIGEAIPWVTIPVGKAVPHYRVDVVGPEGARCSTNEVGEIRVSYRFPVGRVDSAGVIGGLPEEFPGESTHQTGDLGFRLPSGDLMVLGRRDDQVKIRGYRIELEEINRKLNDIEGVRSALSIAPSRDGRERQIFSYVECDAEASLDSDTLQRTLQARLPDYMVPRRIQVVDRFPLLPNGKVDRSALPSPEALEASIARSEDCGEPPQNHREREIAAVLEAIIGVEVRSRRQRFVDLGADSLSAVEAQLRLESLFEQLPEDWMHLEIRELAALPSVEREATGWRRHLAVGALESHLLIRAAAIVGVVALHFGWFSTGGGLTFILFLISGYALGLYQLRAILELDHAGALGRSVFKVILATVPVTLSIYASQWWLQDPAHPSTLLFYANFLDFDLSAPRDGRIVWLWFIAAYVQIFGALYLLLSWSAVREWLRADAFRTVLAAFGIVAALRFGVPGLFDITLLVEGVPSLKRWNYLPTTHASTVLLGVLVAVAGTNVQKLVCTGLIVSLAAAVGAVFEQNNPAAFACTGLALLFVKTLPFPRALIPGVLAVAGASLYIYLMHAPLHKIFVTAEIPRDPALYTVLAVVCSTLLWRLWSEGVRFAERGFKANAGTPAREIASF